MAPDPCRSLIDPRSYRLGGSQNWLHHRFAGQNKQISNLFHLLFTNNMPGVSHWKQELRQQMSPLKLKARSAVHGLTSSSCLPDCYQVCCAFFQSSLDSIVKRRETSVAPTTTKTQLLNWGVYLALNRTSAKCYIHLEGVNSNKVSRTNSGKPCANIWGYRFRPKFNCHVRKIIFW